MSLYFRCILRHTQLRSEIERLVNGQFHVDDIFLRHIANFVTDGIEILVYIDIVNMHLAMGCGTIAGNRIYQGGFAATALPYYNNELSRLEDQRNVL